MRQIEKYYIQGFAMVVSPNRVADCDIYFRTMGHSPNIVGVELWTKEKAYLGFVYPSNLELEVKRAMLAYIRNNKKKWHRVFSASDMYDAHAR